MHSCDTSSEQIVSSGAPGNDDRRPGYDGDQSRHPCAHRRYRVFVPFFDRLLRRQLKYSCIDARQHEEDDFRTKEPTAIALLGFRPEEKDAADSHDDKTKSREGHYLLVHLGYGLVFHSPTHEPQIEP